VFDGRSIPQLQNSCQQGHHNAYQQAYRFPNLTCVEEFINNNFDIWVERLKHG
jgi:hypothetical protein